MNYYIGDVILHEHGEVYTIKALTGCDDMFPSCFLGIDAKTDMEGFFPAREIVKVVARAERDRLSSPEWDGEGLPPVNQECEYIRNDVKYRQEYVEVIPLCFGQELALLRHSASGNEFAESISSCVFRPIKSERDRWIEAAIEAGSSERNAALIYDAGLAKLPETDQC